MEVVLTIIQTVGFPAMVAIMCGWYIKYREDKNDQKLEKLNSEHHEEVRALTDVMTEQKTAYIEQSAALTNAINLLTAKLDRIGEVMG